MSILRRKVITKEILFSYLDDKSIKIQLPTTKNLLIDKIAEIWNIPKLPVPSKNAECTENTDTSISECKAGNNSESDINEMAQQFSKWFYTMLNSGECGDEHFFPGILLMVQNRKLFINID